MGVPWQECMKRVSHRDFKTWLIWEREQWNEPSRTDHYLMQIAQAVYASKSRSSTVLDKFKIPFKFLQRRMSPQSTTAATELSKSRWFGLTGYRRK